MIFFFTNRESRLNFGLFLLASPYIFHSYLNDYGHILVKFVDIINLKPQKVKKCRFLKSYQGFSLIFVPDSVLIRAKSYLCSAISVRRRPFVYTEVQLTEKLPRQIKRCKIYLAFHTFLEYIHKMISFYSFK